MLLLIPGPVSTDPRVRAAAAKDYAPWDDDFRVLYARLRRRVCALVGGIEQVHACLPLPGCGHFAIEAALRTFVPAGGRVLVPMTGSYAERMQRLATEAGRMVVSLDVPEGKRVDPDAVEAALRADPGISHAAFVYSETSTGIVHDVPALAKAVGRAGRRVVVDGVSAIGALPFNLSQLPMVDSVSFTSNKCLEALPGTSMTVSPVDRLEACAGQARSWSFDLSALYAHSVAVNWGAARFTPAAGVLASLDTALELLAAEGGPPARLARYAANMRALCDGVKSLGLEIYLDLSVQGPIVVNVAAPGGAGWNLQSFVDGLKRHGFVISNFYDTPRPSFRVGCIGAVTPDDMRRAAAAMGAVLAEMGIHQRRAA